MSFSISSGHHGSRIGVDHVFLFLQGPHGPFFSRLNRALRSTGAKTFRVGFNAGDRFFWRDKTSFIPFRETLEQWPDFFENLIEAKRVTDIVVYGDVREIHASAIRIARDRGLTVHVFEEGYIRPYWSTYERNGSNGNSRLMEFEVSQMQDALHRQEADIAPPPSNWGDMRQHIFYGALYHAFVLLANRGFRNFRPHREITVRQEFSIYLKRMFLIPWHIIERSFSTFRVRRGGFPYHLALLQLEHDSSFQAHSDFQHMSEFIEVVIQGFASGAPSHHHLVFKAHPLEDGRTPLRKSIRKISKMYNVADRVHFIRGGKLARLLDEASTAVTINSTAGQQVLWRGIPLKTFGSSVFDKPEFVSEQPIAEFFARPRPPSRTAYVDYRRFLLETSQLSGGFYSAKGRRQLLRRVVDMMLKPQDPYDAFLSKGAVARQHLRAIS